MIAPSPRSCLVVVWAIAAAAACGDDAPERTADARATDGGAIDASIDAQLIDAALDAPCDHGAPNTCATATELTSIDGDVGADLRTVTGTTSRFFSIRIADAVGTRTTLSYTATLTSPANAVYELYAYPGDATAPSCQSAPVAGTGSPPTVHESWDDALVDDTQWRAFEVRFVSGSACGVDATWTLTLAGHT